MIFQAGSFLQKTNERIQFYYYEPVFVYFLEEIEDISKLTDL